MKHDWTNDKEKKDRVQRVIFEMTGNNKNDSESSLLSSFNWFSELAGTLQPWPIHPLLFVFFKLSFIINSPANGLHSFE